MYEASGPSRKATTPATSSTVPMRRMGIIARACSSTSSLTISVSIRPGATQLTVMSRLASSMASDLVAAITPALAAL